MLAQPLVHVVDTAKEETLTNGYTTLVRNPRQDPRTALLAQAIRISSSFGAPRTLKNPHLKVKSNYKD